MPYDNIIVIGTLKCLSHKLLKSYVELYWTNPKDGKLYCEQIKFIFLLTYFVIKTGGYIARNINYFKYIYIYDNETREKMELKNIHYILGVEN